MKIAEMNRDMEILILHLEARGVKIDPLLDAHIKKINSMLLPVSVGSSMKVSLPEDVSISLEDLASGSL